jgi:hypothetical protein
MATSAERQNARDPAHPTRAKDIRKLSSRRRGACSAARRRGRRNSHTRNSGGKKVVAGLGLLASAVLDARNAARDQQRRSGESEATSIEERSGIVATTYRTTFRASTTTSTLCHARTLVAARNQRAPGIREPLCIRRLAAIADSTLCSAATATTTLSKLRKPHSHQRPHRPIC